MRTSILIFLVLLLSSCLKDKDHHAKPIIDWPTYGYVANWNETAIKKGTADWETISDGNSLSLYLNYLDDSKKILAGQYKYDPTNLGLAIDTTGGVSLKDNSMIFVTIANDKFDTTAIASYKLVGDTLLILKDTAITPSIEIKYEKADSK